MLFLTVALALPLDIGPGELALRQQCEDGTAAACRTMAAASRRAYAQSLVHAEYAAAKPDERRLVEAEWFDWRACELGDQVGCLGQSRSPLVGRHTPPLPPDQRKARIVGIDGMPRAGLRVQDQTTRSASTDVLGRLTHDVVPVTYSSRAHQITGVVLPTDTPDTYLWLAPDEVARHYVEHDGFMKLSPVEGGLRVDAYHPREAPEGLRALGHVIQSVGDQRVQTKEDLWRAADAGWPLQALAVRGLTRGGRPAARAVLLKPCTSYILEHANTHRPQDERHTFGDEDCPLRERGAPYATYTPEGWQQRDVAALVQGEWVALGERYDRTMKAREAAKPLAKQARQAQVDAIRAMGLDPTSQVEVLGWAYAIERGRTGELVEPTKPDPLEWDGKAMRGAPVTETTVLSGMVRIKLEDGRSFDLIPVDDDTLVVRQGSLVFRRKGTKSP